MRVFNVLLDSRVKPGHDNGGRFGAATAVFMFIHTLENGGVPTGVYPRADGGADARRRTCLPSTAGCRIKNLRGVLSLA